MIYIFETEAGWGITLEKGLVPESADKFWEIDQKDYHIDVTSKLQRYAFLLGFACSKETRPKSTTRKGKK